MVRPVSADNWAICPRCLAAAFAAKAQLEAAAEAAYGAVPIQEFERLRAEAEKPVEIRPTFREDYEIYGAEEGVVVVVYSGHCKVCSLGLDFKDEHPLESP